MFLGKTLQIYVNDNGPDYFSLSGADLYDEEGNLLPEVVSKFDYWTISVGTRLDKTWWVIISSYSPTLACNLFWISNSSQVI